MLARIAPVVGGATIIIAVQAPPPNDPWGEVWRIGLSTCLGIFVTLAGLIYKNINDRVGKLESAAKDEFVPRREYESRHADIMRQIDRLQPRS